jgi:DNA-binding CsgD family transcriptional regulator/sugar-specific transcriptional regulator TrmB
MLEKPEIGVADLATTLGLAETEVRGALDRLADISFLRPSASDAINWRAVSPKVALTTLLAAQEAEIDFQLKKLQQSREAVALMLTDYANSRPVSNEVGFERITGLDAVRIRLEELALEAKQEVLAFAPGGPQRADILEASKPLDEQTLKRGVSMSTVYLESVRNSKPTMKYVEWLHGLGGEVRLTATLPLRMIIADRSTAVIPVDPEDNSHGAYVVTSPGAIAALLALFGQVWASAVQLSDQQEPAGSDELTSQERELVHLLGLGHTDEVVARKLGVSLRTVRRLMADIMGRVGARSRFQAGVRIAGRGWIKSDLPVGDGAR